MQILHAASGLKPGGRPACLAIGFFDGVHLGHQEVLRQMLADARRRAAISIAVTFDQHPNHVVAPDRIPPLLCTASERMRRIAGLGVEATLLLHFDRELSRQTGDAFIRQLRRDLGSLGSVFVGAAFAFGCARGGNLALLRELGQELHFTAHGVPAVISGGAPVSSTRIREAVQAGELAQASRMLGRPFSLTGPVIEGDRLGRQIGFPTANLDTTGLALPPNGVYAGQVLHRGASRPAVINLGYRPTLKQATPQHRVEIHLIDFEGDLYGEELELFFAHKLREERRFAALSDLRTQIELDVIAARRQLAETGT